MSDTQYVPLGDGFVAVYLIKPCARDDEISDIPDWPQFLVDEEDGSNGEFYEPDYFLKVP